MACGCSGSKQAAVQRRQRETQPAAQRVIRDRHWNGPERPDRPAPEQPKP